MSGRREAPSLCSIGVSNTLPVLPAFIDGLAARGRPPITVAELLAGR